MKKSNSFNSTIFSNDEDLELIEKLSHAISLMDAYRIIGIKHPEKINNNILRRRL